VIDEYIFESVIICSPGSRLIIKCKRNLDEKDVALKFCTMYEGDIETNVLDSIGGTHGIIKLYDSLQIPEFKQVILVLEYHNIGFFKPSKVSLVDFFRQLLKAVDFLQRNGIVHCDLKPSNVLVDANGKVTVIDFGLCLDSYIYQSPKGFRGTLRYAAPEVLSEGNTTTKVDAWGLGVIFAELVLGEHPLFHGNTQQEILKEIEAFHKNLDDWKIKAQTKNHHLFDIKLWELIIQLLQISPEKRIGVKEARAYFKENFPQYIE